MRQVHHSSLGRISTIHRSGSERRKPHEIFEMVEQAGREVIALLRKMEVRQRERRHEGAAHEAVENIIEASAENISIYAM